jgi:prepilin-type N-terminal cleavage/methylation domain-containing protein
MKNYFLKNRGFSIVEFLVVIAILGILSTIIFSYLNNARVKSADTTIKSNLQYIRSEARNYIDKNGNYGTATIKSAYAYPAVSTQADCSTANTILANTAINSYLVEAENVSNSTSTWVALCAVGKLANETNATSWAVAVRLKENAGKNTNSPDGYYYWCVSSGAGGVIANGIVGGGASETASCSF